MAARKKATGKAAAKPHKVHIELCGNCLSVGKSGKIDLADGVSRDDCEEARFNPFVSGLDADDLGVEECTVDGEPVELDLAGCERDIGDFASWDEYDGKTLVYAIEVDKASWDVDFEVEGEFDPKRLELHCEEAIYPGGKTLALLTCLYHGDRRLETDEADPDSKGCCFWLFDKNRHAEIGSGNLDKDGIAALEWKLMPVDWVDFEGWEDWPESKWVRIEAMLARHDKETDESILDAWDDFNGCGGENDFLAHALKRTKDWLLLASGFDVVCLLEEVPELADDERAAKMLADYCNDEAGDEDFFFEDGGGDMVNGWAYVLRRFPKLADRCKAWDKFPGYSACRILEVEPQFADRFDLEKLGDPESGYWDCEDGKDDFAAAWKILAKAQPQFARYREQAKEKQRWVM